MQHWMSSGSLGQWPGVDFLLEDLQEEVDTQVPEREPTVHLEGGLGSAEGAGTGAGEVQH